MNDDLRILIPLDGSPPAEAVFAQVGPLLFRKEVELLLVQAVSMHAGMELDAAVLPRSGHYDWRLYLNSPIYGEICERSGYFFLASTPAESTPEATAES